MNTVDFLTDEDLELEYIKTTCYNCKAGDMIYKNLGKSTKKKLPVPTDCVFCHGTGYYDCPTNFGRRILEFVRKYRKEIE